MTSVVGILLALVVVLLALLVAVWFKLNRLQEKDNTSDPLFLSLQQKIDTLQGQIHQNLTQSQTALQGQFSEFSKHVEKRLQSSQEMSLDSSKNVNERLDRAAKFFSELQHSLGKLDEANSKIYEVGKDISSLQEILQNPKSRGSMGEMILSQLLGDMLPKSNFDLQYSFKNNEKVDAIIKLADQIIPIDAKFPLENFKRLTKAPTDEEKGKLKKAFVSDVKKHIDAISRKYIQPDEGTVDFAFMYIPAENVFYEVIIGDLEGSSVESLESYAFKKRIIPVSPNSFYAYLRALMQALRGEKVQKNIHTILNQIRQLVIEFGKMKEDFAKVGYHLNHLTGSFQVAEKRLNRFEDKLERAQEMDEALLEGDSPDKPVRLLAK